MMNNNDLLFSIVIPVYRCQMCLIELYLRLKTSLETITPNFEIILVNDGSPDGDWATIVEIAQKDDRVKGINLSRNFGQHYAIMAGLNYSKGEWVVVMDCDLQDQPEEIIKLYNIALEGYDSVFAQRLNRSDSYLKRISSKIFYALFSYLTETKQDPSVANFGIYNRSVIDAILSMNDQIKYFPTMVQWVGFRKFYLPVNHARRSEGETSYNFKSLFKLAINNIIAFSDKPLRVTVRLGFFISLLAFVIAIVYFVEYLCGYITVIGFMSLILSIWFLSGVIIMILGMVGLYIGKVFEKVKQRPTYIVSQTYNL